MSSSGSLGKNGRTSQNEGTTADGDKRQSSRPKKSSTKLKGSNVEVEKEEEDQQEQGVRDHQSQGTSTLDEGSQGQGRVTSTGEEAEEESGQDGREEEEVEMSPIMEDSGIGHPMESGDGPPQDLLLLEVKKKIRPDYTERFRPSVVNKIIVDNVRKLLMDKEYAEEKAKGWIKELTTAIKDSVKELGYPRYKIIVHVTIGRDGGQGALVASKCVWDEMSDDFAFYSFANGSIFCNAVCYGIYHY